MDFGDAIRELKAGKRVTRPEWNGKDMHLLYIQHCEMRHTDAQGFTTSDGPPKGVPPFLAMRTAQDTLVPWLASQTDVLAEDWDVLE